MLIITDKKQNTLKTKKAQKYNIPIYSYFEAKTKVKEMSKNISKFNL
jgi:hypothetical protein